MNRNRTRRITSDWLLQSGLAGDELLLEALLRRGFLAYRDDQGVWLGTGSHPEDLDVLRLYDGLDVEPFSGHKERMAQVKLSATGVSPTSVAAAIVAIPENHGFLGPDAIPSYGWGWGSTWVAYRNMAWGDKVAICPTKLIHERPLGYNALDIGVALLVKAFPLARVATYFESCDGHGSSPATISFRYEWDRVWGKAVADALGEPMPNSTWDWWGNLRINALGGYGDGEILGMLNDIQLFARRLLHQSTIDKIGRARVRTLEALGEFAPTTERFAQEARHQLAEEFA